MHILLLHQAFAALGEPGGTRHHEMARELAARGHRVTVITGQVSYLTGVQTARGWLDRARDDAGVEIWRVLTYRAWHRSFLHRVLSFLTFMVFSALAGLRAREVDVVWGTSPPLFQGITAWLLARLKGAAFLFEVRDLWPSFAVAVGVLRNRLLIWLAEAAEAWLYRRADRVVINSPGFREHVLARGAKAVTLVPNGVQVSMFDPHAEGEAWREALGLGDQFVALYAGAHGLSNDLEVVLGAAQALQGEEIAFVLVGDGKEKPRLQEQARRKGLPNVHFVPPVPKEGMPEVLAAADACIAVLKPLEVYKTTYPNKVFDYMAAGRPVVLAIDGVIREVVEGAGAGVFVPPGDAQAMAGALSDLASDPERRRRMGMAGRSLVMRKFDRPGQAEALLRVMKATRGNRGAA
jgi:glycosyltransferase involved in cell wall biosynthesis